MLHISGPRTLRMLAKFINLCQLLEHVQLEQGVPDVFAWRLSTSGQYSIGIWGNVLRLLKAARCAAGVEDVGASAHQILLLAGPAWSCWTAHRRWRHGLQDTCSCIICDQAEETMDHIILGCVFSREAWESCLRTFRLNDLITVHQRDIVELMVAAFQEAPAQAATPWVRLTLLPNWMGALEGTECSNF